MVGNSNPVVAAGTSSSQVSAQSAATDAFTQFSTAKKRPLTSPGDMPIDASPEKKRKGKGKQTRSTKEDRQDDKVGEDLMDVAS
jgi:hypothetical protein